MPAASAEKRARQRANKLNLKSSATTMESEPQPTLDITFFLNNATFHDINRFVDAVSATSEGRNLQLLWRRAVREGRDMGYEQGQSDENATGYREGYDAG